MYEFFQFQSGVCSNNILIQTKIGELVISQVKVLQPSNQTQPYMFTLTLHPNQHFNFTIIACNTYGNVSFSTSVSKSSATEGNCKFLCISIYTVGTHSVIAINISTTPVTEITCIFNAGSHAIGCLINLTQMELPTALFSNSFSTSQKAIFLYLKHVMQHFMLGGIY